MTPGFRGVVCVSAVLGDTTFNHQQCRVRALARIVVPEHPLPPPLIPKLSSSLSSYHPLSQSPLHVSLPGPHSGSPSLSLAWPTALSTHSAVGGVGVCEALCRRAGADRAVGCGRGDGTAGRQLILRVANDTARQRRAPRTAMREFEGQRGGAWWGGRAGSSTAT